MSKGMRSMAYLLLESTEKLRIQKYLDSISETNLR